MTVTQHYEDALAGVLSGITYDGDPLDVVTSGTLQDQKTRAHARVYYHGEEYDGEASEFAGARIVSALYFVEVFVRKTATATTGDHRHELAQAIRYAIDTGTLANYEDSQYRAEVHGVDVTAVSPVLDDNGRSASFFVTVALAYALHTKRP